MHGDSVSHVLRNAVRCLNCGDTIESTHRHEFRACSCGAVFVDGGHDYTRRGWRPGAEYEELAEYDHDAHVGEYRLEVLMRSLKTDDRAWIDSLASKR